MKPQTVTNLLLAAIGVLLLGNLAVPMFGEDPPPPAAATAPERPLLGRIAELEAKTARIAEDVERLSRRSATGRERSPPEEEAAAARGQREGRAGGGDELAAVATLRNMSSAQARVQAMARADLDGNIWKQVN